MEVIRTKAVIKMWSMRKRIRIVQGSTSAGKTYGIVPLLIDKATYYPRIKITCVAETVPAIRDGVADIFKAIMKGNGLWDQNRWKGSPMEYEFPNGSVMQFKSFDKVSKALAAGKRDVLFINEANHIPWLIADALIVRSKETWIDFNPTKSFWAHKELMGQPNAEFLKLTFEDNDALPWQTKEDLMIKKGKAYYNPDLPIPLLTMDSNIKNQGWHNWWTVYGRGEVGQLEGQIFTNWRHVEELPPGPYVYGIDFGYTHDPTVLTKATRLKGELWVQQLWYSTGYSAKAMRELLYSKGVMPNDPIICDHDLTAIQDLRDHGFRAFKAHKYAGSVKSGVQALQQIVINVTKDSKKIIEEEENYFWDYKEGEPTGEPIDDFNHAIDAIRYSYDYILNPRKAHYLAQDKARKGGRRRIVYHGN